MIRRPTPAPAAPDRFPRLYAGWRVLLGATLAPSLALADVTPPPSANANLDTTAGAAAAKKAPCPRNANPDVKSAKGKPKKVVPQLLGEWGYHVASPEAPAFHASSDGDTVIHAHGPDEPCKRNA